MKSRIFRPAAALAAFLLTIQVVFHLSPPPADRQTNSEENRNANLEATHAFEALRWYNNQRAYPTGHIPADWKEKALAHISRNNKVKQEFSTASVSWNAVGPNNIGGRVRSIAINPLNPNTIYCGSVSGGIWKSGRFLGSHDRSCFKSRHRHNGHRSHGHYHHLRGNRRGLL